MKNFFFLSSSVFCILCSSLFVFVHHVSHSPPFFRFHFCLIICVLDLLLLETHFSCTSLFNFLEQQFLLPVVSEKIQIFPFYMHGLPLNVLFCSHTSPHQKKNLFVHFPFCCALFHIYLFLHVCRSFFDFSFFSFLNVVLCWSLFMYLFFLKTLFGLNIDFLTLFKKISFYMLSLFFTKKQSFFLKSNVFFFFKKLYLLYCPLFFFKKKNRFLFVGPPKRVVFLCGLFLVFFLFSKKMQNKLF